MNSSSCTCWRVGDLSRRGRGAGNERVGTVGAVRDLGIRRLIAAHPRHRESEIVLLSTDADSVVAPDWARQHLLLALDGAQAAAGRVELAEADLLPPVVAARYAALRSAQRRADGHGNVHAANLAARADAYRAVGGFALLASGEDQDLWRRLRLARLPAPLRHRTPRHHQRPSAGSRAWWRRRPAVPAAQRGAGRPITRGLSRAESVADAA